MSVVAARPAPQAVTRRRLPRRGWSLLSRCLVLAAVLFLLGPLAGWGCGPSFFSGLSPFVAGGAVVATRSLHAVAWLGLLVGVVIIVRRRLFCRWVCPTGLLLEGADRLGRACGRRPARPGNAGSWLLWFTLGGAVLGLPLFLWLDPLAIFSSAASVPRGGAGLARWYGGGMIVLLLIMDIARPGMWCRQLCPLGACQDLVHDGPRLVVRRLRNPARQRQQRVRERGMSRRAWLGLAGGGVTAVALPAAATRSGDLLRPPGALGEPLFNGVCLRCGNCLRACPSGIIRNAGPAAGWIALFTPTVSFAADYCREDCVRCGDVCPSGALRRVAPAAKKDIRIGLPTVAMDRCLLGEERECSLCRDWCPYGAIRYVFCEDDYLVHPRVDPDRCNGCGACEAHCPVAPVKAITVGVPGKR